MLSLPASARDKRRGFSPWVWKISWSRNGNPLQYSYVENSIDGGTWEATVHHKESDMIEYNTVAAVTTQAFAAMDQVQFPCGLVKKKKKNLR